MLTIFTLYIVGAQNLHTFECQHYCIIGLYFAK